MQTAASTDTRQEAGWAGAGRGGEGKRGAAEGRQRVERGWAS